MPSASTQVLALSRGDAVVHQSDLLHGVRVEEGERWSWILWYRDSATCEEHGHEWFARCAREGNAICQGLHANKVGQVPGATAEVTQQQVLEWNRKAAENGLGWSMLKLARASLKRLPSALPYDPKMAARWFRKGIATWQDPECLYGLAQMLLENQTEPDPSGAEPSGAGRVESARLAFEEAARRGHAFAAYNLGVAHLHGHGLRQGDAELAAGWFAASGLPEGLHGAALYRQALGKAREAAQWKAHAQRLGFDAPWREMSRERTGSGGASGVSLYSAWPSPTC